jgi:hypothetical protein
MLVDQLINDIAKATLDNLRNNFDLKQHLDYPLSSLDSFVKRLQMQPLSCGGKRHRLDILEELGKRYKAGEGTVNT